MSGILVGGAPRVLFVPQREHAASQFSTAPSPDERAQYGTHPKADGQTTDIALARASAAQGTQGAGQNVRKQERSGA